MDKGTYARFETSDGTIGYGLLERKRRGRISGLPAPLTVAILIPIDPEIQLLIGSGAYVADRCREGSAGPQQLIQDPLAFAVLAFALDETAPAVERELMQAAPDQQHFRLLAVIDGGLFGRAQPFSDAIQNHLAPGL